MESINVFTKAGREDGSPPRIESTVKLIIFGQISSHSEASIEEMIHRTKKCLHPLRKDKEREIFEFFFIKNYIGVVPPWSGDSGVG